MLAVYIALATHCRYALEAFCENLGDEIVPYMDPLMEKLLLLLRTANRQTQVTARPALRLPADPMQPAPRRAERRVFRVPPGRWTCGRSPSASQCGFAAGDGRLGDRHDRIGCGRQVPPVRPQPLPSLSSTKLR